MDRYGVQYNRGLPIQLNARAVAGARRYRSKSQRPCDLCRARKVLCNIPKPGEPCQLCERTGRQCTFIGNPGKKRERTPRAQSGDTPPAVLSDDVEGAEPLFNSQLQSNNNGHRQSMLEISGRHVPVSDEATDGGLDPLEGIILGTTWSSQGEMDWNVSLNQCAQPSIGDTGRTFQFLGGDEMPALATEGNARSGSVQNIDAMNPTSAEIPARSCTAFERRSIDQRPDHSTQLIGFSNESDPFSLQHFPYNNLDEVDFFRVSYRKVSARNSLLSNNEPSGHPPLHFLQSQTGTAVEARRIVDECMVPSDGRENLERLVDRTAGVALVKLYFRFVFESLPILSRSLVLHDIEAFVMEASTGLLAGIYALALPFTPWDEKLCLSCATSRPSVDALWKISYTCLQRELHFPRLSTVQIFLLLINFAPLDTAVVENPFVWSLAASMLAMAQSLGLNVDPTGWNLPPWEIRLRRRMWWAVVVEYTWRSITHGRSSMLHDDDWNVSRLTPEDFIINMDVPLDGVGHQLPDYFLHMCSLTEIASSICRKFFSLRAVSRPQALETLIEQAQEPRQSLHDWFEDLPESLLIRNANGDDSSDDSVKSHGSLLVAYYTTHILVLRALLRPIINSHIDLGHLQSSVAAVLQASRELVQTVIQFIRGLDSRHQSAFWPTYTRHCLCYPGLFCYMLCSQQKEPHMTSFDQGLLATWRTTLRTRVQSWPLLRFAIVKVDAIYWKKLHQAPD